MFSLRISALAVVSLVFCLLLSGCSTPGANSLNESNQINAIDLDWKEFFKMPIGPLGLEPTQKLLSLENKQVRLRGYMVKEEESTAGLIILTSIPVSLSEKEDGPADDLPATTVFVHLPESDKLKSVNYRAGLWELVGILKLGNQEEVGGRVSYARLMLE